MANVSNPQVLSTLIDLKSQQGDNLKIDTKTAKKIQAETVELGNLLLSLEHQFNGVDSEGTIYFDALSENLDERYIDALDTPHKELQERYEKAFELFLDEIEGKPSHEADKLSPAELKKISDASLKDLPKLARLAEANSTNKEIAKELAIAVATTLATSAVSVSATAISVNLLPIITTSLLCAGPKVLESLADKTMTPTNADRVKQALKIAAPAFAGVAAITGNWRIVGSVVARTAANADVVDRGLKQLFGTGVKKDVAEVLVKSVATTLGHYAGGAVGESVARGPVATQYPQLTHETAKPFAAPKVEETVTEVRPYYVTEMLDGAKQAAVSLNDLVKQYDVLPNFLPLPGAGALPVENTKTEIQPTATVKEVGVRQVDPSESPTLDYPTNQFGVAIDRTPEVAEAILEAISDEMWLNSEGIIVQSWDDVTPAMLDSITGLSLSDNITEFKSYDLNGLSKLEMLEISFNLYLRSIPEGVFDDLTNLEELTISITKISELPDEIFDTLTNLKKLTLRGNKLTSLPEGIFRHNKNLGEIDLSKNELTEISENAFDEIESGAKIALHRNPLSIKLNTLDSWAEQNKDFKLGYLRSSNPISEINIQVGGDSGSEFITPFSCIEGLYNVTGFIQIGSADGIRYIVPNSLELGNAETIYEALETSLSEQLAEETDASTVAKLETCLAPFPKEVTEIVTTMISEHTGSTTGKTDEASVAISDKTTPTPTEIAEEMKEKGVGVGLYAGIGTGISGIVLLGVVATVVAIIIKKKKEATESVEQSNTDTQGIELETIQVEPKALSQPRESVVSLSEVTLGEVEPTLKIVTEEPQDSDERFVEQAKSVLNTLEESLGKMEKELEK